MCEIVANSVGKCSIHMSVDQNTLQNDQNETRMIPKTLSFMLTHSSDRFNPVLDIKRVVWQTARRIASEILGMNGLC